MLSRSPEQEDDEARHLDYREASLQLGELAAQGFSWSGNERNCAFLNTRGGPFANISAVSGFDFLDDGRSLAVTDWDLDGDLDVWAANRTGPRVRLLANETPGDHHFVAFELVGTESNRDAIGARVEVQRADPEDVLLRTVRAGEGFLGQSSKRVHFGLGASDGIPRVTVRWPNGQREDFADVRVDHFQRLVEGRGRAEGWRAPGPGLALPESAPREKPTSQARVFVRSRLPLPPITFETFDRERRTLTHRRGTPVLVNLWASWCQPCLAELARFGEEQARIAESGLEVVALSVDRLSVDDASSVEAAQRLMERLALPFTTGLATVEQVETMQILNDLLLAQRRPLPVPTSFLIDPQGRVGVIYKGAIELDRLLEDVRLLTAPAEEQQAAALHFPGRWLSESNKRTRLTPLLNGIAAAGHLHAAVELADAHGSHILAEPDFPRFLTNLAKDLASRPPEYGTWIDLGRTHLMQGEYEEAANSFRAARKLQPDSVAAKLGLARSLGGTDAFARGLQLFQEVIESAPEASEPYARRSALYLGLGNPELAVEDAQRAAERAPEDAALQLELARALFAAQELEKASAACSRALELQFDLAAAFRLRGRIHVERGDLRAAREDLEQATGWAPDDHEAQAALAWLLATAPDDALRDGARALARATRAGELCDWKDARTLQAFAAACAETGDLAGAVEWQGRALALAPAVERSRYRTVLKTFEGGRPYRLP